jgi:glucose/mannose-6-phosphate isomerase
MTAVDLDDCAIYERLDPSCMRDLIAALPTQCETAWEAGMGWPMPATFGLPKRVVVLGMGGSAIGGDLLAALASRAASIPVQVVRGYQAPSIDEGTLVVAVSHSGETEETIEAFIGTMANPGMRLAITTGGTLSHLARSFGHPLFEYEFGGMPRAAVGWGVFPLLAVLGRLGVLSMERGALGAAFGGLAAGASDWGVGRPSRENEAKQIAMRLHGRIPLIVGAEYLGVVARRWAGQCNENAKQWCFYSELPEANHNLVAGLCAPMSAIDVLHVVFLASPLLHERNRDRIELTADMLALAGITSEQVVIEGPDALTVTMRAVHLGDWVSLYLAMLNNADPTPVEPLDDMKRAMRRRTGASVA